MPIVIVSAAAAVANSAVVQVSATFSVTFILGFLPSVIVSRLQATSQPQVILTRRKRPLIQRDFTGRERCKIIHSGFMNIHFGFFCDTGRISN
jgi:hypothetical protein